ncbi:MAG: fibrobacter succinogenes major paralogous domain-containing protein [Bacteroidales bacterium]|nr:fibrobacter succinogenes major paralogous domain-containing protein [Bacteroidales bacterium]
MIKSNFTNWHFFFLVVLLNLITHCQKEKPKSEITDIDGNVYTSVRIGSQVWMVENLKTTKFNDGTDIPLVTDYTEWKNLRSPGFCWYDNEKEFYGSVYGGLYNWYAVNTGKLCPIGWHVPSDFEWRILTTYLMEETAFKLMETGTTHWEYNFYATNETGFTALPGGKRGYYYSDFNGIGDYGCWWTSTDTTNDEAWYRDMSGGGWVITHFLSKKAGLSVRCIKD